MHEFALYLHLGALAIAAAGILYSDSLGMRWLTGASEVLDIRHLKRAHVWVSTALLALIVTGAYLFWPGRYYLIHEPLFILKMVFVLSLIVNSFAIDSLLHITTKQSFKSLSHAQKIPLFVSGAISLTCWVGAGVTALALFYF